MNLGEPVISGATVELYNTAQKLVATESTSAKGPDALRFTAPGSYAVQVVPPPGCSAQPPVTLDIKMLDEVRVDWSLSAQWRAGRPFHATGPPARAAVESVGLRR